jgi:hypothetical protein
MFEEILLPHVCLSVIGRIESETKMSGQKLVLKLNRAFGGQVGLEQRPY